MSFAMRTLGALRMCGERLLMPRAVQQDVVAGIKVRHWLKLRCKHCYFVNLRGRTYVLCTKFPRHKMMEPFDHRLLW